MPRHKKDYETKMLENSYRADRDASSDQSKMSIQILVCPPTPRVLKTKYARQAWRAMVGPLCQMKRICEEDIVIIQTAFRSLDDAEIYEERLQKMIPGDSQITAYASLVKNYRAQFVEIMRKYGTTLYDRMAMREILSGMRPKRKELGEKMTEDEK